MSREYNSISEAESLYLMAELAKKTACVRPFKAQEISKAPEAGPAHSLITIEKLEPQSAVLFVNLPVTFVFRKS